MTFLQAALSSYPYMLHKVLYWPCCSCNVLHELNSPPHMHFSPACKPNGATFKQQNFPCPSFPYLPLWCCHLHLLSLAANCFWDFRFLLTLIHLVAVAFHITDNSVKTTLQVTQCAHMHKLTNTNIQAFACMQRQQK